jgi:hypothetical protein
MERMQGMSTLDRLRQLFSPEQRRIIGAEAQQLLENTHFRGAWEAVDEALNEAALSCDPDDKEKAQRIILSKQLLAAVRREIERKVADGEFAKAELEEIDLRSRPRRFTRF